MSGSMSTAPQTVTHIDYREAFVLDMEMAAHGPTCKQCILAALKANPDNFCDRMKYMREYVKRAYEALPPYYKQRYEAANESTMNFHRQVVKDMTGGR